MPWQGVSAMDLRTQFVVEFVDGGRSMTELFEAYGVSRPTGYKWVERYATGGPAGLVERSRRPHHSPRATPADIVERLRKAREHFPHEGGGKLVARLRRCRRPRWRGPRRCWRTPLPPTGCPRSSAATTGPRLRPPPACGSRG